jgi:prepilin-type N-terminal cleavage/methylation domain-containing protein
MISHAYSSLRPSRSAGFTLMELIVVVTLLSILLVFAIPRFESTVFQDDAKRSSRWIIGEIQMLKESAVRDQKRYTLHVNLDNNTAWETNESMSQEDQEQALLDGNQIPGSLRIIDVEFPSRGLVNTGVANIRFFKGGYSDKAMIHAEDGETRWSFLIEPFLSEVRLIDGYAGFEN